MNNFEFLSSHPFEGWVQFRSLLKQVPPEQALGIVQLITNKIANKQGGVFRGCPPVFPINLHVVVRELISELPGKALPTHSHDPKVGEQFIHILLEACRQINDLRNSHPAMLKSNLWLPHSLKFEENIRKLWFHHLEQQGLNWAIKIELGRSARMFGEIWGDLYKRGKIRIRGHASTAFNSPEYLLLLSLGTWLNNGIVQDVRELFAQSMITPEMLRVLLDTMCIDIDSFKGKLKDHPLYPESIQNLFQRYPLIRIGDWSLIAPLPDLLLQGWDIRALFEGLDCALANVDDEQGAVEYYRALGVVYEEYVRELILELSTLCNNYFIPSFKYDNSNESPDAFLKLKNGDALIVEAKCYRVPQYDYTDMHLDRLKLWFFNLLGSNDRTRLPLFQGSQFFDKWKNNNKDIVAKLDHYPGNFFYLIISHEDVPIFTAWTEFRKWLISDVNVDSDSLSLWERTIILSIRDLETIIAVTRAANELNINFDIVNEISAYLQYRKYTPDIIAGPPADFKSTIGIWMKERFPFSLDYEPNVIKKARNRLFDLAIKVGFKEEPLGSISD